MRSVLITTIFLTAAPLVVAQSFQQALNGKRLILEGAQCAGWKFRDAETVLRFDEMICSHGGDPTFQARIRWVAPDQFILVESSIEQKSPICPPRVWYYKVESLSGSKVTLKEFWLGWGANHDSIEHYRINK